MLDNFLCVLFFLSFLLLLLLLLLPHVTRGETGFLFYLNSSCSFISMSVCLVQNINSTTTTAVIATATAAAAAIRSSCWLNSSNCLAASHSKLVSVVRNYLAFVIRFIRSCLLGCVCICFLLFFYCSMACCQLTLFKASTFLLKNNKWSNK